MDTPRPHEPPLTTAELEGIDRAAWRAFRVGAAAALSLLAAFALWQLFPRHDPGPGHGRSVSRHRLTDPAR